MRSLQTGDSAASFTLPLTNRRAMATTCVAVLPKPAAWVRRFSRCKTTTCSFVPAQISPWGRTFASILQIR